MIAFLVGIWIIAGGWFAFAGVMTTLEQGIDDAGAGWLIFVLLYIGSWALLVKNKNVWAWFTRKFPD
jgi:hypothetical protein